MNACMRALMHLGRISSISPTLFQCSAASRSMSGKTRGGRIIRILRGSKQDVNNEHKDVKYLHKVEMCIICLVLRDSL